MGFPVDKSRYFGAVTKRACRSLHAFSSPLAADEDSVINAVSDPEKQGSAGGDLPDR
jgi:hypothetical protein